MMSEHDQIDPIPTFKNRTFLMPFFADSWIVQDLYLFGFGRVSTIQPFLKNWVHSFLWKLWKGDALRQIDASRSSFSLCKDYERFCTLHRRVTIWASIFGCRLPILFSTISLFSFSHQSLFNELYGFLDDFFRKFSQYIAWPWLSLDHPRSQSRKFYSESQTSALLLENLTIICRTYEFSQLSATTNSCNWSHFIKSPC